VIVLEAGDDLLFLLVRQLRVFVVGGHRAILAGETMLLLTR
jgi:hypothetical protein